MSRIGLFNQEVNVGDYIVYGIERSSLNYGLIVDIKRGTEPRFDRVVVARLVSDSRYVWDPSSQGGHYTPHTELTVKLSTTGNLFSSVIVPSYMIEESDDFLVSGLVLHKDDILAGVKKFAF